RACCQTRSAGMEPRPGGFFAVRLWRVAVLGLAGEPARISPLGACRRHGNVALVQSRDQPNPRQFHQLLTSLGARRLVPLPRAFARIGEIFLRLRTHLLLVGLSLIITIKRLFRPLSVRPATHLNKNRWCIARSVPAGP